MDNNLFPSWIVIVITLVTNLSAIIIGVVSWIKAAKMMPKELKQKDLDIRSQELSMVGQYDEIASKAVKDKTNVQNRLDILERDYGSLQGVIAEQAILINKQSLKVTIQGEELKKQEEKIEKLTRELNRVKTYNRALIKQMQGEGIIPISIDDVTGKIE